MKDHALTEDIIQENFMRALDKPPKIIDETHIEGWLITLTRNATYNFLRKSKKWRDELNNESVYTYVVSQSNNEMTVEDTVEIKFLKEAIQKNIKLLNPDYRQVMEMRIVRQLTYSAMAKELNTTEGAVRQKLFRAREIIRKQLKRDWGVGE